MRMRMLQLSLMLMIIAPVCFAQELVDAIAAHVDRDIILLSEVRELSRYQPFA